MPRVVVQSYNEYESLTIADTALGLTASKISGQSVAFITVETAQIRFRLDGTAPTASEGHLLEAGDDLTLEGATTMASFKVIRTTATSAVLKCSYGT